jgi:cyclopropane-fatty-acyl-phospholipid synthase
MARDTTEARPMDASASAWFSDVIESPDQVADGIRFHYDLPPDFFKLFLDHSTMSYTCAYFGDGSESLDTAQLRKLELCARKLDLKPGDRLLDIGLGWGNMALFAAELGCDVTGMTLAPEQAHYVEEEARRRGLQARIHVLVEEARTLPFPDASFDKVVMIGATEQVADIATLFKDVHRVLADGGLCLQHSITASAEPSTPSPELDFMVRHIFPTGRLKTLGEYIKVFESAFLEVIDVHDMTDSYPLTLHHWLRNLERNGEAAAVALGVPAERWRAQRLFLAGCIVSFTEGHSFLYQELMRKTFPGRYRQPLPGGRERTALADPPSRPLPSPVYAKPLVQLRVGDSTSLWVEGLGGAPQPGDPPREPDCTLLVSAETMARVTTGKLQLIDAFLSGLVDVEGDILAAAQLASTLLKLAG